MDGSTLYYADLAAEVEVPKDGIISRTLHNDDHTKVVLFGFDAGQELSEHTSSMPAILQVVKGEGDLGLGSDTVEAKPGSWAFMPPKLPHRVVARSPMVMILVLIKGGAQS